MVFDSAYIQIPLQNSGEKVVFLGGWNPPLGTNGRKSPEVVQSGAKRKSKRMSKTSGTSFVLVT